ncbi:hypothetical protein XENORESO_004384 [Xenotaenia resolanae]|uniref:Uncharacterized protein n=1 Tax=Xenotaenia resolanae TaxID=208358 RepID=A0ABV0X8Q7_9TELE
MYEGYVSTLFPHLTFFCAPQVSEFLPTTNFQYESRTSFRTRGPWSVFRLRTRQHLKCLLTREDVGPHAWIHSSSLKQSLVTWNKPPSVLHFYQQAPPRKLVTMTTEDAAVRSSRDSLDF